MSPTEIQITLKMMQDLRDSAVSGSNNEQAWFTIALGIAERLDRAVEFLESIDEQLGLMAAP